MIEQSSFYKPLKILSLLAIFGLAGVLLCDLIHIFLVIGEIVMPTAQFETENGEYMSVWLMLIGLVTILRLPIFILTAVFFLIWLNRGYKNLTALKVQNAEFTPGWAVVYWFIPILNLFKPFQVVRELWNESDPDFDPQLGFLSSSVSAPVFMRFWWACWLIYIFTARIADRILGTSDTILSTGFLAFFTLSSVFGIIAAILAIMIVKRITQRQELRFQHLNELDKTFQPPPPPIFK